MLKKMIKIIKMGFSIIFNFTPKLDTTKEYSTNLPPLKSKVTKGHLGPQIYLTNGNELSELILDRSEQCPSYIMGTQGKNIVILPLEHLLESSYTVREAAIEGLAESLLKGQK